MARIVRDDPENPDPGFAELYASLPDAADVEPWLSWCRAAEGPVLYMGIGAGRLAVPLARAGVELVGVDAHPVMLEHLRARLPDVELVQSRVEDLELGRRFDLVIGPSSILALRERLASAARHTRHRVAFQVMNPHWLAAGERRGVRVHRFRRDWIDFEVDYPGGWTQVASGAPLWPEDVEDHLAAVGLELELMRGQDPDAELAESPSYYVLARLPAAAG
jgi:Methyltransferase domain